MVIVGRIIGDALQCFVKVMGRMFVISKSDLAKNFAKVVVGKELMRFCRALSLSARPKVTLSSRARPMPACEIARSYHFAECITPNIAITISSPVA